MSPLSATEAQKNQVEAQLQETIQRLAQRDEETKDMNEKLNAFQGQIKFYEQQISEASAVADGRKLEVEETLVNLEHLEGIVEELQKKSSHLENENKDGIEVKSRDIGSTISTPTKRQSKKKLEGESSQTSQATQPQTIETSNAMTFKFVLGVALVSVIVGIILGKRY